MLSADSAQIQAQLQDIAYSQMYLQMKTIATQAITTLTGPVLTDFSLKSSSLSSNV